MYQTTLALLTLEDDDSRIKVLTPTTTRRTRKRKYSDGDADEEDIERMGGQIEPPPPYEDIGVDKREVHAGDLNHSSC